MTDDNLRTEAPLLEYKEHSILGADRTAVIFGAQLAHVTTEKPDLIRWTEITLWRYRPVDPSAPDGEARYLDEHRYLFQVVAKTLVYHAAHTRADGSLGSRCGKGLATTADKLTGYNVEPGDYDAQPCPDCHPPLIDDLAADTVVFMEKDWPRFEQCADAAEVRRKLAEHNPRKGPALGPGSLSALNHPSQRLLENAALIDPAFGADKMIDRL